MRLLAYLAGALALVLSPCAALGQSPIGKTIVAPSGYVPVEAIYCDDGTGKAALCNFGSGGGGGGGTSTVTSRINYLATASGTGYAIGDQLERVVTSNPSTGAIVYAYWVNVTQAALLASAPAAGTFWQAKQPVSLADGDAATLGARADPKSLATDTTPASAIALLKGQVDRLQAIVTALGSPVQTGGGVDIVVKSTAADRGQLIGTTAIQVAAANASRRGWAIQVQAGTSVSCYVNGSGTATADYHSLQVGGGGYFQSPDGHVGTGALSVICSAANTPVYFREW